PKVYGKDVKLSDYRYEMDAKPMVQWVDENRDHEGEDPTKLFGKTPKVPWIRFIAGDFDKKIGGHPAIWNPKKMRWEIELAFVDSAGDPADEDGVPYDYGYEPGVVGYMPPEEIEAVIPPEEKMIPPEEVPVIEPPIEVPDRELLLLKAEIKRLKQEARLEKAKALAARERTALIKELREIGYTKAEIKAELAVSTLCCKSLFVVCKL
ncbi:unnamed protein product, partial [marine sediment metagenome]